MRKSNILLIGPPGVGKTILAKNLARHLKVPFSVVDATALTGLRSSPNAELFAGLLSSAGGAVSRAQYGIICIENLHTMAKKEGGGDTPWIVASQQALASLLAGEYVDIPTPGEILGRQTERLNTGNIFFICEGSFPGIESTVRNRLPHGSKLTKSDISARIEPRDLVAYGLSPELVASLGFIIPMEDLGLEDLVAILSSQSLQKDSHYFKALQERHIAIQFTNEAYTRIAREAQDRASGALGLESVLADLFLFISARSHSGDMIVLTDDYVSQSIAWRRRRLLSPGLIDISISERHGVILEKSSDLKSRKLIIIKYTRQHNEEGPNIGFVFSELVDHGVLGFVGLPGPDGPISSVADAIPYPPLRTILSTVLPLASKLRLPVIGLGDTVHLHKIIEERSALEEQRTFADEISSLLTRVLGDLETLFPIPEQIKLLNTIIAEAEANIVDPLLGLRVLGEVVSELGIPVPSHACPSLYKWRQSQTAVSYVEPTALRRELLELSNDPAHVSATLEAVSRFAALSTDPVLSRLGGYLSGSVRLSPCHLQALPSERVDRAFQEIGRALHDYQHIETLDAGSFDKLRFREIGQQFFEDFRNRMNTGKYPNLSKLLESLNLAAQAESMSPEHDCRTLGTILKAHIFAAGQDVERLLDDWNSRIVKFSHLCSLELSRENYALSAALFELDPALFIQDFGQFIKDSAVRDTVLNSCERVRLLCGTIQRFFAAVTSLTNSVVKAAVERTTEAKITSACLILSEYEHECCASAISDLPISLIVIAPKREGDQAGE